MGLTRSKESRRQQQKQQSDKVNSDKARMRLFAQNEIDNNDVVIFSKTFCSYCDDVKNLFRTEMPQIQVKAIEVETMFDMGASLQAVLLEMTGQRTVPCVFVKGEHFAGFYATQAAYRKGRFDDILLRGGNVKAETMEP